MRSAPFDPIAPLLAGLLLACGGSAPPVDNAARGGTSETSVTAEVGRCASGPFAISLPVAEDSDLDLRESDACALVPAGMAGADPFSLPWAVALMFVPVGDGGPERALAVEPDGARQWANALMPGATPIGEGSITLLGITTSWYGLHGRMPDGRDGDAYFARVAIEGTYFIAVGASPEMRPDLRERYLAVLAAITRIAT